MEENPPTTVEELLDEHRKGLSSLFELLNTLYKTYRAPLAWRATLWERESLFPILETDWDLWNYLYDEVDWILESYKLSNIEKSLWLIMALGSRLEQVISMLEKDKEESGAKLAKMKRDIHDSRVFGGVIALKAEREKMYIEREMSKRSELVSKMLEDRRGEIPSLSELLARVYEENNGKALKIDWTVWDEIFNNFNEVFKRNLKLRPQVVRKLGLTKEEYDGLFEVQKTTWLTLAVAHSLEILSRQLPERLMTEIKPGAEPAGPEAKPEPQEETRATTEIKPGAEPEAAEAKVETQGETRGTE